MCHVNDGMGTLLCRYIVTSRNIIWYLNEGSDTLLGGEVQ